MSLSEQTDTPTLSEPSAPAPEDPIVALRNEFAEQFTALKTSYEEVTRQQTELINQLKEENDSLHRALIRSAVTPQPAPEKTPEQLYEDRIQQISRKALDMMAQRM